MNEYRVYHRNSPARTVAVTPVLAHSPKDALKKARSYAIRWNMTESRPTMIVKFLECDGEIAQVTQGLDPLPLFQDDLKEAPHD